MIKYLSKFYKSKNKSKNNIIEVETPIVQILEDNITEDDIRTLPIAKKYYPTTYYWNENLDNILLNIVNNLLNIVNNNLYFIHWGKVACELNKKNLITNKIFFAKDCRERYDFLVTYNNNNIVFYY